MTSLFEVDVVGLQQTIQHDVPRILMEPVSNALDTAATDVLVRLTWSRGVLTYFVEDNDPDGFAQLHDAYTLFAASQRKAIATARGRFGFGEKEFIALSYPGPVSISTTSGTVTFDRDGRTVNKRASARRDAGSAVTARIRMPRKDVDAFADRLRTIIVPPGVNFTIDVDGHVTIIPPRPVLRSTQSTLPTILADQEGILRPTKRQTTVALYGVMPGETATLYELGIPVVAHPGSWHIDVGQKIPLSRGRDAVTSAYLRAVHVAALEAAADLLTPDEAKRGWVVSAMPSVQEETLRTLVHLQHGADAVIADPSNPEATMEAVNQGRTVVYGGAYPAEVWESIRRFEVLLPAGRHPDISAHAPPSLGAVRPTPEETSQTIGRITVRLPRDWWPQLDRHRATSPDGPSVIPAAEWSLDWDAVARYASALGLELTGQSIQVSIVDMPDAQDLAICEDAILTLNVGRLPASWWTDEEAIDRLLIEEFAQLTMADHPSHDVHGECCRLGAMLRRCRTRLAAYLSAAA